MIITQIDKHWTYDVKNSFEFERKIDNINNIDDNHFLISLDVESLYTNINRHLIFEIINNKRVTYRKKIF